MSVKRINNKTKIATLILAFIFCAIACASVPIFIFDKKIRATENQWHKVRVADSSLYSDNGYVDYASKVFLDDVTYPDMKEMGLYWTKWDEANSKVVEIDADSEEGAALIDPAKPTMIFVHGMLTDGYYQQEKFYLSPKSENPAEFDLTTDRVSLMHLWQLEGWNVGLFHYNRFGSESAPTPIEAKVWATDGQPEGMRIRHTDGSYTHNVSEYSLAEHFVAEYLRAMNLLPETMGNEEIRIAAHSMGGEVLSAGIFLLTEVSSAGQLAKTKLPDRYSMLDPYFCVNLEVNGSMVYLGPKDITIRWSGKPLYQNNTGYTILECLKDLVANGIAIDYYTHKESTLKLGMPEDITASLRELCVYVIVSPDYASYGKGYTLLGNGHNGVRDWYYCSIRGDMVKNSDANSIFSIAASAKTPTSVIAAQKGMAFNMTGGAKTVNSNDDIFTPFE